MLPHNWPHMRPKKRFVWRDNANRKVRHPHVDTGLPGVKLYPPRFAGKERNSQAQEPLFLYGQPTHLKASRVCAAVKGIIKRFAWIAKPFARKHVETKELAEAMWHVWKKNVKQAEPLQADTVFRFASMLGPWLQHHDPEKTNESAKNDAAHACCKNDRPNRNLTRPVFLARPQPRSHLASVPCHSPTATPPGKCSLPDPDNDITRPVFSAGPQPRPHAASVPCRICALTDPKCHLMRPAFPACPKVTQGLHWHVSRLLSHSQTCFATWCTARWLHEGSGQDATGWRKIEKTNMAVSTVLKSHGGDCLKWSNCVYC